jgi:hypothetical protein
MDPIYLNRLNPKYLIWAAVVILFAVVSPWSIYQECRIEVPNKQMAVLIHKTGDDLDPGVIIAPSSESKGVQKEVLTEGRYYYNPYEWDWQVVPQVEIPEGKLGVRIRMYGDDLAAGELIAWKENQKGIVSEVLRPGRYPINAWVEGSENTRQNYAEIVELHDPITIPECYKEMITEVTTPLLKQTKKNLRN